MKEIDFYIEFSEKFTQYLRGYMNQDFEIVYSVNKSLDLMISELNDKLNTRIEFENEYIPKLKLDILFAVKKNDKVHLILIEAKYLKKLSLKDYSQLSGYLQVAKNISTGILLLIVKGSSPNKLSNDFNEIVKLKKLPMNWTQIVSNNKYLFQTGIMFFQPRNGIDWIDSKKVNGISDYKELAIIIEKSLT